MKILAVALSPDGVGTRRGISGAETVNRTLLEAMAARGTRGLVVTDAAPERHAPLPAAQVPMRGAAWPMLPLRLSALLRRERPDIVLSHGPIPVDAMVGLACRAAGMPLVVHRHIPFASLGLTGRKAVLYAALDRIALQAATRVVYLSQGVTRDLEGRDRRRAVVIPNGVDLARFGPVDRPSSRTVVGCIAQMVPHKGWSDLFAAMRIVRERVPGAALLCVGDGPDREALEAEVARLGLDAVFTGNMADVRPLLAGMDVFVLPSWREGLSMAAMEAMVAGLPTVLTRVDGTDMLLEEGVTGAAANVGDPPSLAEAILTVLPRCREMGRAARARAERLFDRERQADAFMQLFADILAR